MDGPPENTYNWYEDQQRQLYHPQEISSSLAPQPPMAPPYIPPSYSFDPPPAPFHGHYPNPSLPSAAPQPYDVYGGYAPHSVYPDLRPGSSYNGVVSGGGEGQGFFARESGRLYGVHPLVYQDTLRRYPSLRMPPKTTSYPKVNAFIKKRATRSIGKVAKSAYCEICKIECNSAEVFASHRAGKRHRKNVEKTKEQPVSKNEALESKEESAAAVEPPKQPPSPVATGDLETKKKRLLEGGAAADSIKICTICDVVCNSEVVYGQHIAGHRHASMAKKLVERKKESGD